MKKILLKTGALIFALIFVLSSFVACGDKEEVVAGTEVETQSDVLKSRVPDTLRFDGETVNMVSTEMYREYHQIEEGTSGIIPEALLKVNLLTQEQLGITLNFILDGGALTTEYQQHIQNSIQAADGAYDLVANVAHASVAHTTQGFYYNVLKQDENNWITPSYEWWNQEFVNEVTYKNKLFTLVGDYTLSFTDRAPVMFYNEEALKNYNMADELYQKVMDGEWTIEYLSTLIKGIYEDLDGSGAANRADFYGLFYNNGSMCNDAQIYAAGVRISKKQADGSIALSWTEGLANEGFAAVYKLIYETDGVYVGKISNSTYYGETTNYYSEQAFFEKRCIFAYGMLSAAKSFALDPSLQYGILPLPKYSVEQEYATTPQNGYEIMAIPYNVGTRLSLATATLEVLAEFSYNELRPVYYDTAYKIRYASSENTAVLFDMIIDSMGVDFASYYNAEMNSPVEALRNRLDGANGVTVGSSLSGLTAQFGPGTKRSLNKLLTTLEGINN